MQAFLIRLTISCAMSFAVGSYLTVLLCMAVVPDVSKVAPGCVQGFVPQVLQGHPILLPATVCQKRTQT